MDINFLKKFEGKNCFFLLQNGRQYKGLFEEVIFMGNDGKNEIYLVGIIDRNKKYVAFDSREIKLIQEEV